MQCTYCMFSHRLHGLGYVLWMFYGSGMAVWGGGGDAKSVLVWGEIKCVLV